MTTERQDIYERITLDIIAAVERGAETCRMPWHRSAGGNATPINAVSKRPYRGVNVLNLWGTSEARGYPSGYWATYNQWQELGAQVKKGEKSTAVVFWKFNDSEKQNAPEESAAGEQDAKTHHAILARGYHVFNAAQVDGFEIPIPTATTQKERIDTAESFFSNLGADIRHGGDRAFYSPKHDYIQMPCFEAFDDPVSYYSVLSHEATHLTGSPSRLNRDLSPRFGEEAYAAEELIAELGAAFLCGELGLSNEPRPDHAGYLSSWLKCLKSDKRAIFTAASKAQAAVDWMREQQKVPIQEAA